MMQTAPESEPRTEDIVLGGRLRLWQPQRGYRFGIDPLLLAWQAASELPVGPPVQVLDLCAGCGVAGLALAAMRPEVTMLTLVEAQPAMAQCAVQNGRAALPRTHVQVLQADVRTRVLPMADRVLMNPPWYAPGTGRINPDPQRAMARHLLLGTLAELVAAAAKAVRPGGWLHLVVPASSAATVEAQLRHDHPPGAIRCTTVRSHPQRAPHLALIDWCNDPAIALLPRASVCIRDADDYTAAMQAMLAGETAAWCPSPHSR